MTEPFPTTAAAYRPSQSVVPFSHYSSQATRIYNSHDWQADQFPKMDQTYRHSQAPQHQPAVPVETGVPAASGDFITAKLVIGLLVGAVVIAIPLTVMTVLYVQAKSTSSSSSSNSNSGSSGSSSSTSLPSQCTTYTSMIDQYRYYTSTSCCYTADCSLAAGWYRILGSSGSQLATFPISTGYCGQSYPAWFNGTYPTTAGTTITGVVCSNYAGTICSSSYATTVSVTNCSGFYVFYLVPFSQCSIRYCTM